MEINREWVYGNSFVTIGVLIFLISTALANSGTEKWFIFVLSFCSGFLVVHGFIQLQDSRTARYRI